MGKGYHFGGKRGATGGLHIPHHPDPYLHSISSNYGWSLVLSKYCYPFFLVQCTIWVFYQFWQGRGALNFPINFLYFLIAFVYWLPVCITFFFLLDEVYVTCITHNFPSFVNFHIPKLFFTFPFSFHSLELISFLSSLTAGNNLLIFDCITTFLTYIHTYLHTT